MTLPEGALPSLMVVDDEPELLEILTAWFTGSGYRIITFNDPLAALAHARAVPVDIVITDLKMPGMSGLQLLEALTEVDPLIEVIMLSGQGTMEDAIAALRGGRAFDFLQKPVGDLARLTSVVETAYARRAARSQESTGTGRLVSPAGGPAFSPRELALLAHLSRGLDNRAIAEALFVSEKTVKNQLTALYSKLEAKSRTQAIAIGRQRGLT